MSGYFVLTTAKGNRGGFPLDNDPSELDPAIHMALSRMIDAEAELAAITAQMETMKAALAGLADRWDYLGNTDIEKRDRKWREFNEGGSPYLNGISHETELITERANATRSCAQELCAVMETK